MALVIAFLFVSVGCFLILSLVKAMFLYECQKEYNRIMRGSLKQLPNNKSQRKIDTNP